MYITNRVQALHWINQEVIAAKYIFADFTSTGPFEHHIKKVLNRGFKTPGFTPAAWKGGLEYRARGGGGAGVASAPPLFWKF